MLVSQRSDDGGSGVESLADILIATPGRLVDHINNTAGLTLEHVQFLVVDEADRLLGQSYQEWLSTFLKAAHRNDVPDAAASWSDRRPPPGCGNFDVISTVYRVFLGPVPRAHDILHAV